MTVSVASDTTIRVLLQNVSESPVAQFFNPTQDGSA
jgi:hypothetical protein